jgi:hypothetical protein
MWTRRKFLGKTLQTSTTFAMAPALMGAVDAKPSFTLRLADAEPVEIPANFIGLGYEMSSVATPGLLSIANDRYVELIKGLGPEGVLRVGGIVANYSRYIPDGSVKNERQDTVITRANLEQFAAFLEKIGWTSIWSVNFAQGTIDEAITEARAVYDVLGSRLLALEIGNEVDTYGRGQPFRDASYDYAAYRKEYETWHSRLAAALPRIPFAAPDTASAVDWVENMAQDADGKVQLLTTHYYRNGQKRGTADQLLSPDPRLKDIALRMRAAGKQSGVAWRMCEINSFSGGGLPGVSDTFVGALWTLNTMLLLAQYGCSGVNMETGVNQLGFVSSYSPIQDDGNGKNFAGVPYAGMLAFRTALAGCSELLPLESESPIDTLTAYALGVHGKPRSLVVLNMDRTSDATVSLDRLGLKDAEVLRLTAPAANSTKEVAFAGVAVGAMNNWKAKHEERLHGTKIEVPRLSAVVIRSADTNA